ncbi:G1/S-specific cyclin-D2-like isoform X2 [Bacillus rossius redtenbacheri]|uniref:G1/S-specific cyclin-D2-like isoform X2 n=1 Tax=Bacillus rossius redtenbacheri TaxID=93214 RepID=UPI002FDED500
MNLLCYETQCECRAHPDAALMGDDRVLQNLLSREERYSPSPSYFSCVQTEVTPDMRRVVAEWLLEIAEEQQCQEGVVSLAMNYMDRFLTACTVKRSHLQLLGAVCLLIASKLREPCPLAADLVVYYGDSSFSLHDLQMWELLVLVKLKWDIAAVTPQDFLHYILRKLPVDASWDLHMIIRHAQTFVAISARDHSFLVYLPSMIAAASLAAALAGLDWPSKTGCSLGQLLNRLHAITGIEKDYLESCLRQVRA